MHLTQAFALFLVFSLTATTSFAKPCSQNLLRKLQKKIDLERNDKIQTCQLAELDGKAPREAVMYLARKEGKEVLDFEVLVFSLKQKKIRLMQQLETHSEFLAPGYLEILDLDANGRDEIIVVGDTDGLQLRELLVLQWANGHLTDKVYAEDPGISYLFIDVDGNSRKEIVALSADNSLQVWRKGEAGYYRRSKGQVPALKPLLQKAIANNHFPRFYPDLIFFRNAFLKSRQSAYQSKSYHEMLQQKYQNSDNSKEKIAILQALGLSGHPQTGKFLQKITYNLKYSATIRGAAFEAWLLHLGSQQNKALTYLRKYIENGGSESAFLQTAFLAVKKLSQAEKVAAMLVKIFEKPSYPLAKKKLILYRSCAPIREELSNYLLKLAVEGEDETLQRIAAIHLESVNSRKRKLSEKYLQKAIQSKLPAVQEAAASLIGRAGKKNYRSQVKSLYTQNKNTLGRRKILNALYRLKAFSYSTFYQQALQSTKDKKTRLALHRLLANSKNSDTIVTSIAMVRSARELSRYDKIIQKRNLKFLQPLLDLAENKRLGNKVRSKSLQLLQYYKHPKLQVSLEKLLSETSSSEILVAVLETLAIFPSPRTAELLQKTFTNSPRSEVRNAAILSLGKIRIPKATNYLLKILQKQNNKSTIKALSLTRSRKAREALQKQLSRQEKILEQQSDCTDCAFQIYLLSQAIFQLNKKAGLLAIEKQLKRSENAEELIHFLGNSGEKRAKSLLLRMANHPSRPIREATRTALRKLQ
ncbi:MAG: HEAT repeat domain-containing protein [Spirochaetota bacterium]